MIQVLIEQLLHVPGQTWGNQMVSVSTREHEGAQFQLTFVRAACVLVLEGP